MIKVVVIGTGNVASHLTHVYSKTNTIEISQVNSRNLIEIPLSDIIIIAVSDDAIATVSKQLKDIQSLVVHTSGAVDMNAINQKRKGVFYPLQSFTKDKSVDFSTIPICIESTNNDDIKLLENLASSINSKPYKISTEQRKKIHLAAVFVNNFTNYMYTIGQDICEENTIPFEILQPLILETANKVKKISPRNAQTGPAKRNDKQTITNHLENLNLQQQEIYKLITKSIQEK
jgi:predicted short-subunit dehydrogenase-like oxidoreductase (DUF2520 family)